MNKKILFFSVLSIFLLAMMPHISSIEFQHIKSKNERTMVVIDCADDGSIFKYVRSTRKKPYNEKIDSILSILHYKSNADYRGVRSSPSLNPVIAKSLNNELLKTILIRGVIIPVILLLLPVILKLMFDIPMEYEFFFFLYILFVIFSIFPVFFLIKKETGNESLAISIMNFLLYVDLYLVFRISNFYFIIEMFIDMVKMINQNRPRFSAG